MAYRYLIYLHKIGSIFTPLFTLLPIMEGSYPYNQDAADFILAGSGNQPWFTINTLSIGMPRVLMTYSYNTGGRFA